MWVFVTFYASLYRRGSGTDCNKYYTLDSAPTMY